MTRKILVAIGLLILSYSNLLAQEEELFGFDFTHTGKGETEFKDEISIQKYDLRFNLPVETKIKDTYLMHSLELGTSNIHFGTPLSKKAKLSRFHKLSYTTSLLKPLKNDWYLVMGAGAYVYSNFDSSLQMRELKGTGYVLFSKFIGKRQQYELTLGMMYHPSLGFDYPVPMLGVNWKPNEFWTISLGFPDVSVNYNLTKSTLLGMNLFINGDEFTLSKSDRISRVAQKYKSDLDEDMEKARVNKFKYTEYGIGFHIKQKFLKNFQAKINAGYSFDRKFEFKKGTKKLLNIQPKDKYFIQLGVSYLM